jgi:neural Wiskott-Aldrich syndrome protein
MASSSSSVSWTPAPGRHAVNIGPSLGKALKARKLKASPAATATTKRSNLPERDFYSFRCMFNADPCSLVCDDLLCLL